MKAKNNNLIFLEKSYKEKVRGVILEGSSRSGKTYSSIFFIVWLCSIHENAITINIVKETYNSFKTTLYDDFSKILDMFGLDNPFERSKEIATFRIWNHKINFLGADMPSKFHGASADFYWFNEPLEIPRAIFDQAEMRCRVFWWMDLNPSVTEHWIFSNVEPRPDVKFFHSTYKDNPHISKSERQKILSYEPTAENIQYGTADDFMWKVYGLGLRAAPEGLIYKNITWIDELPETYELRGFGMDFGFTTDPTAIVECLKYKNNFYLKLHHYAPIDDPSTLYDIVNNICKNAPIIADSSDKNTAGVHMVSDLRNKGLEIYPVKKFSGSVIYQIDFMNQHKIHIVRDVNAKKEAENYKYMTINGIKTNIPVDKYNHFWDASAYCCRTLFRG